MSEDMWTLCSSAHGTDVPGPISDLLSPPESTRHGRPIQACRWSFSPRSRRGCSLRLRPYPSCPPRPAPCIHLRCRCLHFILRCRICCESPVKAGPASCLFSIRPPLWARSWPATDTPADIIPPARLHPQPQPRSLYLHVVRPPPHPRALLHKQ